MSSQGLSSTTVASLGITSAGARESIAVSTTPSGDVVVNCSSSECFRCLICLEECPIATNSVLSCHHAACKDCLLEYWTYRVEKQSDAFPDCPAPYCKARASYHELLHVLPPDVMQRVRQLQTLKMARTADGRPLFCVRQNCFEALPPPYSTTGEQDLGDGEENETQEEGNVTECPECRKKACVRCGLSAHGENECAQPLPSERETRLYRTYAVGRIGSCPRCGTHIIRDGGCQRVRCTRCGNSFNFVAFSSAEEAIDMATDETTGRLRIGLRRLAGDERPPLISVFLMIWSTVFSCAPLAGIVGTLDSSKLGWGRFFFLPFVAFGVPAFVYSVISVTAFLVVHVAPRVGHADELGRRRISWLLIVAMLFICFAIFHVFTFVTSTGVIGSIYLAPFVIIPTMIVLLVSLHFFTVGGHRFRLQIHARLNRTNGE